MNRHIYSCSGLYFQKWCWNKQVISTTRRRLRRRIPWCIATNHNGWSYFVSEQNEGIKIAHRWFAFAQIRYGL